MPDSLQDINLSFKHFLSRTLNAMCEIGTYLFISGYFLFIYDFHSEAFATLFVSCQTNDRERTTDKMKVRKKERKKEGIVTTYLPRSFFTLYTCSMGISVLDSIASSGASDTDSVND